DWSSDVCSSDLVITCKLCSEYLYRVYVMFCYVILCLLCYAMVGCCVVPCPKNFSAESDPVSFCASDNKRLVTCNFTQTTRDTGKRNHPPVFMEKRNNWGS